MSSTALVLSPVTPRCDGGAALAPVLEACTRRGIDVTLCDTAAFAVGADTLDDLADRLCRAFPPRRYDAVIGNALGGAAALVYATRCPNTPPVLSISGPARSTPRLAAALRTVAEPARRGELAAAMTTLHRLVAGPSAPATPATTIDPADVESACRRLADGLRLLYDIDLTALVRTARLRVVTVVGAQSSLVTTENAADSAESSVIVVPDAGMRPHHDVPACVPLAIDHLLRSSACI